MGQSNVCQAFQRLIVVHIVVTQNAAMSMGGVFTHAYIGNHIKIRIFCLNRTDCLLDNAVLCPGTRADFILMCRQTEQNHFFHTGFDAFRNGFTDTIRRPMVLSRQGWNFLLNILSFNGG